MNEPIEQRAVPRVDPVVPFGSMRQFLRGLAVVAAIGLGLVAAWFAFLFWLASMMGRG